MGKKAVGAPQCPQQVLAPTVPQSSACWAELAVPCLALAPEPCCPCVRRLSSHSTRTRCAETLRGGATSPGCEATKYFLPLLSLCPC